jgi:hypothetical protein
MRVTPPTVADERDRVRENPGVVPLINGTRDALAEAFDTDVAHVAPAQYRREVDTVFADGDVAVNVAALAGLLRDLDVAGDYPGFVVDELLGRELAGTIAGGRPLSLLAEATFHYADVHVHGDRWTGPGADATGRTGDVADDADGEPAGVDDLDAALAAGFQTRLPGWSWTESESPFAVPPTE